MEGYRSHYQVARTKSAALWGACLELARSLSSESEAPEETSLAFASPDTTSSPSRPGGIDKTSLVGALCDRPLLGAAASHVADRQSCAGTGAGSVVSGGFWHECG
jgi:hypothetical protein